jgi:pilus assembly protein TadC
VVAAAGLALIPWWVALPAGVLVAVVLLRLPGHRSAVGRERERRLIAEHADLFASCLDAGMATGSALLAVSDVLAPSVPADRSTAGPAPPARLGSAGHGPAAPLAGLDAVAAMLSLGADPATAWRAIDLDGDLAPLVAAALRSAAGGGGLAEAVRDYAAQLRQDIAAESVRAAGRAGVLMTAPLGVCFLPAFLCLGLAPVVVGLLGQLQIF